MFLFSLHNPLTGTNKCSVEWEAAKPPKPPRSLAGKTTTQATSYVCDSAVLRQMNLSVTWTLSYLSTFCALIYSKFHICADDRGWPGSKQTRLISYNNALHIIIIIITINHYQVDFLCSKTIRWLCYNNSWELTEKFSTPCVVSGDSSVMWSCSHCYTSRFGLSLMYIYKQSSLVSKGGLFRIFHMLYLLAQHYRFSTCS